MEPSDKELPSARFEFPKMLYEMLEDCTFDGDLCRIISWQDHGLAFKVRNREEMEKVLPKWFREKYESWRCLLEQWGFLKLSRGKNRGCWYHKNFVHRSCFEYSKNKYEKITKKEFSDGMPLYLSPREEPDLDKLSTLENRISSKQRKRKAIASKDSIDNKNAKVEKTIINSMPSKNICDVNEKAKERIKIINNTSTSRYSTSNHKACQYCGVFFMPQGLKKHEKSCAMAKDLRYNDDDDDIEKENDTPPENEEVDVDVENPQDNFPCKHCGNFFNKYGLKTHEKHCIAAGNKNGQQSSATKKGGKGNNRSSTLSDDSSVTSTESGCQACGFDDDHANLLLCEGCETELHTYCLDPPLEKVPEGDWFCDLCSKRIRKAETKLGKLICKVPSEMMERFGEICFAKSAENAHWWPALIFDPRSFLHNAEVVELARRNLGKRYLVFFFENQDAFAAISKSWIMSWEEGIEKEYDKGRCVRHASKNRRYQFERAMDAAKTAFEDDSTGALESPRKSIPNHMAYGAQMGDDNQDRDGFENIHHAEEVPIEPPKANESLIFREINSKEWQLMKAEVLKEVEEAKPSMYPTIIDDEILRGVTFKSSGKWQCQPYIGEKLRYVGMFHNKRKATFAAQLVRKKLMLPVPTTTTHGNFNFDPVSQQSVSSSGSTGLTSKQQSLKRETSFGSFVDKKPNRSNYHSSARIAKKTKPQANNEINRSLQQPRQDSEEKQPPKKKLKLQEKPEMHGRGPTRLQEHERYELLSSASFCSYYILPLSEI